VRFVFRFLYHRGLLTDTQPPSVAVLPYGRSPDEVLEPWEYWIAKIRDVRAELHNDGVEQHNTVSLNDRSGGESVVIEFLRYISRSNGFILGKMWGMS